jgi:hypothetical protein
MWRHSSSIAAEHEHGTAAIEIRAFSAIDLRSGFVPMKAASRRQDRALL